jgi:hypothetical protein
MPEVEHFPEEVKRLSDAHAVWCVECEHIWTDLDPVPWGLRSTVFMHRRGCPTHTLRYYR